MKLELDNILNTQALYNRCKGDPLMMFVLGDRDLLKEIKELQLQNFGLIKRTALNHRLRYIYIGTGEICGCENIQHNRWPAMWKIAEDLGLRPSCGNSDQYQAPDLNKPYLSTEHYGAWDLVKDCKLSKKEIDELKFNFVITKDPIL